MLGGVRRARIFWIVIGLLILAMAAMYVLNPFNSRVADPRARIAGFTIYRAPSSSMAPTVPEGAILIISVAALRDRDPSVGEIIVFKFPPDPRVEYIKRVLATGGSTVEMRKGVVWLDGEPLVEPWLPAKLLTETVYDGHRVRFPDYVLYSDMPAMQVPESHFFVLGDNRGNSQDSRAWGLVPRELVIGTYVTAF
jgi:signal peptidase I